MTDPIDEKRLADIEADAATCRTKRDTLDLCAALREASAENRRLREAVKNCDEQALADEDVIEQLGRKCTGLRAENLRLREALEKLVLPASCDCRCGDSPCRFCQGRTALAGGPGGEGAKEKKE